MAIRKLCSTASIIALVLCFRTGVAEIVTKPTGTEAVCGRSTYLNCSTNSPQEIHWFHTPVGSGQDRSFVYGYNQFYAPYKSGRFAIEKNQANDAYNLIIQSVEVEDAGQYECQDQNGQGKKESAQLTVLDTDPACEPRMETLQIIGPNKCGIEPNQLILSCTVKYHGNEAPIMKWRKIGDKNTISEGVTHQVTDNNHLVYNLTIKGNSTVKDGDSYFCNTTRSATLNDGCKSGKIEVKGTSVDCPTCAASEICNVNSYIVAVICFFLIVLPTAIIGTVFVLWYLRIPRPRQLRQREAATAEERDDLQRSASTPESNGQGAEEDTRELNRQTTAQEECSNGQDIKIKTLENHLKRSQELIDQQNKAINDLIQDDESNKAKNDSLQLENAQLQDKVRDMQDKVTNLQDNVKVLEQSLYSKGSIDYAEKPTLVQIIKTDAAAKDPRKPINGMSILDKELFVLHENSSTIEVYDKETFKFERNWVIEGMLNPMDIASCKIANCNYIIFREDNATESQIMKLDPKGQLITKWLTGGDNGRLSTYESNVIVCLFEKQQINEYNRDGNHIHTVRVSPGDGFKHPWHAIKVTSSHFAVCHGDVKDGLHRVCIVDVQGKIIKKLGQGKSPELNVPICLVEDSERSILVADRDKHKIRLLNCFLKYERNLIKQDMGSDQYPVRISLDESKGRLFIAENALRSNKKDWKNGRIVIFNIRKTDG